MMVSNGSMQGKIQEQLVDIKWCFATTKCSVMQECLRGEGEARREKGD